MVSTFTFPVRVYYEDTDCGGVVYHSNYLSFMSRARSEWFLSKGIVLKDWNEKGIGFAVHSAELKFISPARLHDSLHVVSRIEKNSHASLLVGHVIQSAKDSKIIFCKGLVKLACVNHDFKPCQIPQEIIDKIDCKCKPRDDGLFFVADH